jgi:hypothetical protein
LLPTWGNLFLKKVFSTVIREAFPHSLLQAAAQQVLGNFIVIIPPYQ